MKTELIKIIAIFLVVTGVVFWGLSYVFFGNGRNSKAAGETIALSFNPASVPTVATNSDLTVKIAAKPSINALIRGYGMKINFDKTKLAFKSMQYLVGSVSSGLGNTDTDLAAINSAGFIKVVGEAQSATGYSLTSTTGADMISLTFTALSNSPTSITIGDSSFYSISADMSLFNGWTFTKDCLSVNGGTAAPTATTAPNSPTATTAPAGNVTLNMKFKVQGIAQKPTGGMNVKVKLLNESTGVETGYQTAQLTANDQGIWSGSASFNVDTSAKYVLYAKGQYQVQKKICDATPTETAGGTYRCTTGKISLTAGANNLDFSGIILLSGDLPEQDGTINAYDTSLIRNNLNKTDADTLSKCDVNRDGKCDTQDYSLLISTLSVKNDEQ